jgi:hypothetical protein
LKTIASAAAREPAPRVTLVRSRTVENMDSMGFVPGMKVVGAAVRVLVTRLRPGRTVRPSGQGVPGNQHGQADLELWAASPPLAGLEFELCAG